MRYRYLGTKSRHFMVGAEGPYQGEATRPDLVGMACDPVRRHDGRCVRGALGTALVVDGNGVRHVVARRRLRLAERWATSLPGGLSDEKNRG